MKQEKRLKILTIVFFVICLAEITTYIVLDVANVFVDRNHYLETLFAIITPILVFIWAIILAIFITVRINADNMRKESEYAFGKGVLLYNYYFFEKAIRRINFFNLKKDKYIICFTHADYDIVRNLDQNVETQEVLKIIAEKIASYCTTNFTHKKSAYCYYRGCFYIYLVGDEMIVDQFMKQIEKDLYALVSEQKIKTFVQPFFGLLKKKRDESLFVTCENAFIARNFSEKNFEKATYYTAGFRNQATKDDVQEIANAIINHEFVVYYQPKFHLASRRIVGAEALVRWNSNKYGLLTPQRFIEKAEKSGLIHELDMYVFQKVCEDLNETKRRGRRLLPVSINFSLYEFFSPNFIEDILAIMDKNKISTNLIEIEITESTSQSNTFLSTSIMKQLKNKGFKILMDDFGVGYSNFNNLKKMPFDTIKIDKSFFDDLTTDSKTKEIVKFLINLCKTNGLEVIAEGIDSKQQVDILKSLKCDTIQGYYFSKPLSKVEYDKFLSKNPFEKKGGNEE